MLEFIRENIIPIMVVVAVAIFAYRFIKLMKRDKQAKEAAMKKASQEAADPAEADNVLPQDDQGGDEGQ